MMMFSLSLISAAAVSSRIPHAHRRGFSLALLLLLLPYLLCAQTLSVKVIDRRSSETHYTYRVRRIAGSGSRRSRHCVAGLVGSSGPCSYKVSGATLSLLLPDGRIAVVNCDYKFEERFSGPAGNRRSCRMPMGEDGVANFKGENVKLSWAVSLDGRKKDSETYKVVGVLPAEVPPQSTSGNRASSE